MNTSKETIVFFNLSAHGHINPTLPIVKELVRRDKKVIYYCFEEFRTKIERSGAEFRPYQLEEEPPLPQEISTNFITLARVLLQGVDRIIENHLQEIKADDPDCIVYDSFCPWGQGIAQLLDVKAVASKTTLVTRPGFLIWDLLKMLFKGIKDYFNFKKLAKQCYKKYGLEYNLKNVLSNEEKLSLVYTSRYFQPQVEKIPDNFKFVGPSIDDRELKVEFSADKLEDKPTIYISLGTILNEEIEFFQKCLQLFKGKTYQVVMSVGRETNLKKLTEIPDNFIVKSYLPQLEVLKKADLFISHGGMNSVHEALYYTVPLVLIPQQPEQKLVANRVEELGAGICCQLKNLQGNQLKKVANKILTTSSYYKQAAKISNTFREAGNYKRAVDLILDEV